MFYGFLTCLLVCSSQADSSCVAMFLKVTTTPLGILSTALKWSSYKSLAIVFTYRDREKDCLIVRNMKWHLKYTVISEINKSDTSSTY